MFRLALAVSAACAAELALCGASPWRHVAFLLVSATLFVLACPSGARAALRRSALACFVGERLFGVVFTETARHRLEQLQPHERPYVLACEPHGAYVLHMVFGFAAYGNRLPTALANRLHVVAHWSYLLMPFLGVLYELFGVMPSARFCVEAVLARGDSIAICPSGVAGKWHSTAPARADDPENGVVVLKRNYERLGFLVLAARHGAHVVPVLSIDEHRAYATRAAHFTIGRWLVLPRVERVELRVGTPINAAAYDHTNRDSMRALADAYYAAVCELGGNDCRVTLVTQ